MHMPRPSSLGGRRHVRRPPSAGRGVLPAIRCSLGGDPEQRRGVLHDGGHLLIVARAGSSKPRTLACRCASLLATMVQPEPILLLTFSWRAAREMVSRASQLAWVTV